MELTSDLPARKAKHRGAKIKVVQTAVNSASRRDAVWNGTGVSRNQDAEKLAVSVKEAADAFRIR
jgi:hypothetical protein